MIDENEIFLGLLLVIAGAVFYVVTQYGYLILILAIIAAVLSLLVVMLGACIKWLQTRPPRPLVIAARGKISTGSYIVSRALITPRCRYPVMVVVSYFNWRGTLTASRSKILNSLYEETAIRVGVLDGRPVIRLSTGEKTGWFSRTKVEDVAGWSPVGGEAPKPALVTANWGAP